MSSGLTMSKAEDKVTYYRLEFQVKVNDCMSMKANSI